MTNLVAGNYEIIKELGRGGMGVVYLARDKGQNREVAIKELLLEAINQTADQQNVIARFRREAQAASKLQHPGIVSVYDYFVEGDRHFMVMEFLEGKSLQDSIDNRQPFSPEQTADLGSQICAALDYAHSHRIVHRDIKPDNVILLTNGRIKLMDFGIARHEGEVSKLTQAGTTLGTMAYISPEQLSDSRLVDGRSDLFSLGAMLYEMLTLRTPFDGGNMGATIMKIMSEEPVPLRQMNPSVPPRLEAVIMRALRKKPEERFPRASEMEEALNAVARGTSSLSRAAPMAAGTGPLIQETPKAPSPPTPMPLSGPLPSRPTPMPSSAPLPPRPVTGSLPRPGILGTGALQAPKAGVPRGLTGPLPAGGPLRGARYLMSFGSTGANPSQFNKPSGLAFDPKNQLIVADTENGRLQVFTPQGKFVSEIKPPAGKDSFKFPRSVAFSTHNGRMYVIDDRDHRIFPFDATGKPEPIWERKRNTNEVPLMPGRLAISSHGHLYLSEPNAKRVSVFSYNHLPQPPFGVGELQSPSGVAIAAKGGGIYVLDYGQCKVHQFSNIGKSVQRFGERGSNPGQFSMPKDLIVDKAGHVLVADTLNHRVQVFSPQGDFLFSIGQRGKGEGEFSNPEGLAIGPDDLLFVSDRNNRIQVFQLERGTI
jgi:serine/threonine protein kinase